MTDNETAFQALMAKFTQSDLAEIAGTARQYISLWLTVPPKYAPIIAERTGIPVAEVLPDPYAKPLNKNPDRWRKKAPSRKKRRK